MSAPATHVLIHPVTVKFNAGRADEREEEIREVTLRRIKGKDLRLVDTTHGEIATSLAMIARLSGLAIAQVDELDSADIAALGEIIEGFTPPGLKTGQTSSAT